MSGVYRVLGIADRGEWLDLLKRMPAPDVHFEPGYLQVFREGEPRLFVYEREAQTVIYPFILRPVNGLPGAAGSEFFYDITSPYGYGGPLYPPGTDQRLINDFYACFQQFCRENNIITEFIRFHPLLRNHELMTGLVDVARNSTVVFVDLSKTPDEIWSGYDRSNRKNINKARRENVSVVIDNSPGHFADFMAIYRQTLDRNNAGLFYYFPPDFFERVHCFLPGGHIYAHAWKDGRIVASELLIYNKHYIHSFLGGTLADYFIYRPNNLLKHEIINWAKQRGIKYFVLGGGRSDDDGIFRYKSTFSRDRRGYYIGKKVHNEEIVARLTGCPSPGQKEDFFPPYRG
ncbi:GNAT family N-acetyltransferase [Desulfallas sp. Bu1-1]|uniref:lipid II:glycine glycyltransferase FemX n=1 Tax=Desulfallas sp. Bu1-1 TaxID=2787620 RepID=UPI00189D854F|nr:GNAT family N-acetyltransferase [Desulfallas sp. Bu1-1]MBF7081411.1 GNAT family N-acetyltransferase [Desulfallas sp. Bu1-1]